MLLELAYLLFRQACGWVDMDRARLWLVFHKLSIVPGRSFEEVLRRKRLLFMRSL